MGGMAFGTNLDLHGKLHRSSKSCIFEKADCKLSPNVTNIVDFARVAEEEGADSVSLINTFLEWRLMLRKMRPSLSTITGGLSGPAIKPVALRMVWQVANAVKIPVIGMGGIMTASDAIEFILAGASAIQVGTASFIDPLASVKILEGIENYLVQKGIF